MAAIKGGHAAVVKLLLACGADPSAGSSGALAVAAAAEDGVALGQLLSRGVPHPGKRPMAPGGVPMAPLTIATARVHTANVAALLPTATDADVRDAVAFIGEMIGKAGAGGIFVAKHFAPVIAPLHKAAAARGLEGLRLP